MALSLIGVSIMISCIMKLTTECTSQDVTFAGNVHEE